MNTIKFSLWQRILSATIASGLLVALAPFEKNNSLLARVQFDAPGDVVPKTSVGGGVRGKVEFAAPGESAPKNSVGGGVRGEVEFETPGDATPNNSVSGGVRSDRASEAIALLPPSKYGRTVSAHPTFFVYLPQTNSKEIFFSLQDEQGESHYQTRLKVSGKGGIVSVTLPKEAPELEIGKNYLWFFAPLQEADGILRPDNYVVTGWVRRIENKIGSKEQYSSPIEAAAALAKAGIWYDTLKILATAMQQELDNTAFVKEWKELLEQVGLAALATQPLVENL
ncbi:MAG: DUF928 domain-containing protein [Oscillatoriaceae bacterium SKW80]|nr:DUF928 domain-containing protein [Oscillatoriaceae bacterium SKYG93]MCX8122295.1 DUF928 domain-containing protein [Oscillatoriaceae bacterium SKW80]MDW8452510.1 DUF928 domain-containing protein [Oscillatoriaceae cyanobacterium SKYGB_i_bin93]HIK29644.1 DUF928 domain-containing protein [Oscillatoriaceae cyanobacterium M7585_C2015_266]